MTVTVTPQVVLTTQLKLLATTESWKSGIGSLNVQRQTLLEMGLDSMT